jgi:hypothetical protein
MYGDPSDLMAAYNKAKHVAKTTDRLDEGRVDRAWGMLMKGNLESKTLEYGTTIEECQCPDSTIRGMVCKHSIGLMIVARANNLEGAVA